MKPPRTLPRPARNTLLTIHIVASVALLGDVLALLAVTLTAMGSGPAAARTLYEIVQLFGFVFGIPLSMTALVTGLVLGWGTRWGILRHWWVTAKLGLTLTVILAGALVIGPAVEVLLDRGASAAARSGAETRLLVGIGWQIAALLAATGLSVFKPGRARRSRRTVSRRAATELANVA
jgi:hypothetical protein